MIIKSYFIYLLYVVIFYPLSVAITPLIAAVTAPFRSTRKEKPTLKEGGYGKGLRALSYQHQKPLMKRKTQKGDEEKESGKIKKVILDSQERGELKIIKIINEPLHNIKTSIKYMKIYKILGPIGLSLAIIYM